MSDYKEKIKNLLALSNSSNEYEARSALLKARELMAKHKILESEITTSEKEDVVRKMTGVFYSMRNDPWIQDLASVIAQNHCCGTFVSKAKKKQTGEIGFYGLSCDIDMCMTIFLYAVDCVRQKTKRLKKTKGVRSADGYGFGFVIGLNEAYREQNWALVLTVPNVVKDKLNSIPKQKSDTENKMMQSSVVQYVRGMADGRKFHEQKRIAEGG